MPPGYGIGEGAGLNQYASMIYNADTQALFNRMSVSQDPDRKVLINDFITGIKNDFNIAKLSDAFDCLWFKAGSGQQESLLNWAKDAHNLSEVNMPTWTVDRGYAGNGTNSYLDSNYNPATEGVNFTQDNCSWGLYFRTNLDDSSNTFGAFDVNGNTLIPRKLGDFKVRVNSAASSGAAVANSLGLFSGVRENDSANLKSFQNGNLVENFAAASSPLVNLNFYLLALNNAGSDFGHTTREVSFGYAGSGTLINQPQLFTRVKTYLDAIGAGVV